MKFAYDYEVFMNVGDFVIAINNKKTFIGDAERLLTLMSVAINRYLVYRAKNPLFTK